jgi:hypothetical protein
MSYVVANRVFVKQQYTEEFEPRDFEVSITTSTPKGDQYPEIRHPGLDPTAVRSKSSNLRNPMKIPFVIPDPDPGSIKTQS